MSRRWLAILAAMSMLDPGGSALLAQPAPAPVQQAPGAEQFDVQQLDALLAPIALYPDQLLTQVLMAATYPLEIVQASRWMTDPAHGKLTGDALSKALEPLSWDPSVKSLVPFPQVLSQMNGNLDWTQQLGYAFANQQKAVLDSVQRLRRQAQSAGHLQSTQQQVVRTEAAPDNAGQQTIVIAPAQPDVVYVPSYSPTVVYGTWPYPAYPPVVAAPAPGYVVGTALLGGLAFGAGVAITAGLWGWSSPNWSSGSVNVNVNRWNNINVNRTRAVSGTWNSSLNRPGGLSPDLRRPPGGPVGRPVRNAGLPANAVGRPNVSVPGNVVNRPARPNPGAQNPANRPNLAPGSRPGAQGQRPNTAPPPPANRPNAPPRPAAPAPGQGGGQRPGPGAFGGMNEGRRAGEFGQRGGQSRQAGDFRGGGGGGFHGGGRGRR